MKIAAFEIEDWEADAFGRLSGTHEIMTSAEPLDPDVAQQYAHVECVSTFMDSKLTTDTLNRLERLRLIATRSTGFEHIDLDYCQDNEITVCNVPSYGKNTVAEHAFALLLAVSKRIMEAADRTRRGEFSFRGLQGFDLQGKTLGVVGTGDIGLWAIRIANGFGMRVIAFDVKQNDEAAADLEFEYVGFDELLSRSDVITIHVPANPQTEGMFGHDEFAKMKQGAVLINTARGQIVDIRALVKALAEGGLRGAGLDVLPEEPVIREEAELLRSVYQSNHALDKLLADHVVTNLRNVVVTPHCAFNTREAVQRILDTTIGNIEAFEAGRPENVVGGPTVQA